MTETQERFLRTVLSRVPLQSVVELHLFPSLRRGAVETGVAVIATLPPVAPLAVVDSEDDVDEALLDDADARDDDGDAAVDVAVAQDDARDAAMMLASDDDSPYRDESRAPDADFTRAEAQPRLRILTARYRNTIKGVERGAWVVDVHEEADAPLDAVEAVLRGVRQRSTEPADPELIGHDALVALLAHGTIAPAA